MPWVQPKKWQKKKKGRRRPSPGSGPRRSYKVQHSCQKVGHPCWAKRVLVPTLVSCTPAMGPWAALPASLSHQSLFCEHVTQGRRAGQPTRPSVRGLLVHTSLLSRRLPSFQSPSPEPLPQSCVCLLAPLGEVARDGGLGQTPAPWSDGRRCHGDSEAIGCLVGIVAYIRRRKVTLLKKLQAIKKTPPTREIVTFLILNRKGIGLSWRC